MRDKGYITTAELMERYDLNRYHIDMLLRWRLVETVKIAHYRWWFNNSLWYNKEKILAENKKRMEKHNRKQMKEGLLPCLFTKISDDKALEFCYLAKRGLGTADIMRKMRLKPELKPLVRMKVKYLRGD